MSNVPRSRTSTECPETRKCSTRFDPCSPCSGPASFVRSCASDRPPRRSGPRRSGTETAVSSAQHPRSLVLVERVGRAACAGTCRTAPPSRRGVVAGAWPRLSGAPSHDRTFADAQYPGARSTRQGSPGAGRPGRVRARRTPAREMNGAPERASSPSEKARRGPRCRCRRTRARAVPPSQLRDHSVSLRSFACAWSPIRGPGADRAAVAPFGVVSCRCSGRPPRW
jgi:hypothetical protein